MCVYHGVLTPKRALMDARHIIAACDCAQLGKLMDLVSTCLLPMPLGNNHVGLPETTWLHCAHVSSPRCSRSSHGICSARDEVNGELRDHNLPTAIHDDLPLWAWLVLQWDTRPRGVPSNHRSRPQQVANCSSNHCLDNVANLSRLPLAPDLATDFFRPNHSCSLHFTAIPENWGSWIPNSASFLQYATSFHRNTICDWPPILPLATC